MYIYMSLMWVSAIVIFIFFVLSTSFFLIGPLYWLVCWLGGSVGGNELKHTNIFHSRVFPIVFVGLILIKKVSIVYLPDFSIHLVDEVFGPSIFLVSSMWYKIK